MNKLTELFVLCINNGLKSAEMVSEADKKAVAYAELAKAIAKTGLVGNLTTDVESKDTNVQEETNKKESKKTGKDSIKTGASKGTKNTIKEVAPIEEEPVAEEPVNNENTEQELTEEWTEEMMAVKSEQLEILNAYVEAWGDDYVYNECVSWFSEGAFKGAENITPLNIDGFVAYLAYLAEQSEQAEE